MEKDYAIEVCLGNEKQKFCVLFDCNNSYDPFMKGRRITWCGIVENPTKKIYSGSAIKNPNDIGYEPWIGRKWAYKRAVRDMWLTWLVTKRTNIPFEPFWKLFRMALGRNELYLAERKAKDNG